MGVRKRKTYLGLAANGTEGTSLALELEIWQAARSVERGLIGGVGRLSRLDASDVEAATSRGSRAVLRELTQSTEGGRARSSHDAEENECKCVGEGSGRR